MGVEAGLCYNMGSVTAKPEWDIRLLSNCGLPSDSPNPISRISHEP